MKPSESFLPDFCSLPTAFVLVMASLLLAFVLTLADFSSDYDFWTDLGLRGFFIVWIVLLSGAVLCGFRKRLAQIDALWSGLAAFGVVQAVTLLIAAFTQSGFAHLGYDLPSGQAPALFYLRILAVSSLITAAWLHYLYVQSRWRLQIKAEGLARLDALQARMQPHFLFNSLNTVASLIAKDPAAAEELLLDFAEVFRAILKKDAKLVSLAEEIGLARQYLNIEQQRLGSRLDIIWDVDEAPRDALIPPLSLQPLAENAIRHGIERSLSGGKVEIRGRLTRQGLVLTVSNTLPDTDIQRSRPGAREAMANLRARLDACFPDQARLYTSLADGRYQTRIVIPYVTHRHENTDR
jgi:two-component system sensor histidine kinase AlgZ